MSMAIEFIGKMILLVVVVSVAIFLIGDFFMRSSQTVGDLFPKKGKDGSIIAERVEESGIVGTEKLEKYCRLCRAAVEEFDPRQDAVCYIIKGTFSPSSFPKNACNEWKCSNWSDAKNVIIGYNWKYSSIQVEC